MHFNGRWLGKCFGSLSEPGRKTERPNSGKGQPPWTPCLHLCRAIFVLYLQVAQSPFYKMWHYHSYNNNNINNNNNNNNKTLIMLKSSSHGWILHFKPHSPGVGMHVKVTLIYFVYMEMFWGSSVAFTERVSRLGFRLALCFPYAISYPQFKKDFYR